MTDDSNLPALVAFGFVAFALVAARMKLAAQPLRLTMAEDGERLLGSGKLNAAGNSFVRSLLDTAFSYRKNLLFMAVFAPAVVAKRIFRPENSASYKDRFGIADLETKNLFDRVNDAHTRIVISNHPALALFVAVWIVCWSIILIACKTFMQGLIPNVNGQEIVFATADKANSAVDKSNYRHRLPCAT